MENLSLKTYAILSVQLCGLNLERRSPSKPSKKPAKVSRIYLKIRIGHMQYRTPPQLITDPWSFRVEFPLNYHAHLFHRLQLDVFEVVGGGGRFLGMVKGGSTTVHVGRAEIPMFLLREVEERPFKSWYELRTIEQSFLDLSELRVRRTSSATDPDEEIFSLGGVQLDILYRRVVDPVVLSKPAEHNEMVSIDDYDDDNTNHNVSVNDIDSTNNGNDSINDDATNNDIDSTNEDATNNDTINDNASISIDDADASEQISAAEDTPSITGTLERQEQQAIEAQQPPARDTGERMGMFKRLSGFVFNTAEYESIQGLLNLASALGQGIEVGNLALTIGYVLLSRFYATQPILFENRLEMTRAQFELPRVLYRYTMATYGWKGLTFMGKGRRGILAETIRTQADLKSVLEYLHLAHTDLLVFELGRSSHHHQMLVASSSSHNSGSSSSEVIGTETTSERASTASLKEDHQPTATTTATTTTISHFHKVFKPNFFVVLDRRYEAVVLSIRGTMSLGDVITDLSCEYAPWRGGVVHSGLLMASQWFLDHIGRQLLLFAREYGMPNIYIVGHSLGGAIAALTTVMLLEWLKDTAKEQSTTTKDAFNIHCYAYGPPPIATRDLLDPYRDHIDTFVYGEDVVPHLSYDSVVNLKTLLVFAAEIGSTSHLLKDPTPDLLARIGECRAALIRRNQRTGQCVLHLPGHIHHLVKLRAPQRRKYTVIDEASSEQFTEVRLRAKMATHHFPWTYERALENAYATFLVRELEEDEKSHGGVRVGGGGEKREREEMDSKEVSSDDSLSETTIDSRGSLGSGDSTAGLQPDTYPATISSTSLQSNGPAGRSPDDGGGHAAMLLESDSSA